MNTRATTLDIRGMSCATCASTIEDTVADLDGMRSVDVNFATDEATLEYDPGEVDLSAIYDAIEDAGYEPDSTKTTVEIAGMTCATCAETNAEAIESGDITLMRDDPIDVIKAMRIADATISKVRQNLFWAFAYNTTLIPIASIGLLNPALAGIAMAASSVSVVSNSLAFMKWDPHDDYVFLPFRPFVWAYDQLAGISK